MRTRVMQIVLACSCLSLAACKDKVPDKFTALGIPADPERVEKIEEVEGNPSPHYTITYRVPPTPEGIAAMEGKIAAAGYAITQTGDLARYKRADDKFAMSCKLSAPAVCILNPDL